MSSLNSIYAASNKLRFTGMFSGIDTDAIVKSMLATQKLKMTRLDQSVSMAKFKRDAYLDVNNQLRVFREKYMSALSSDSLINPKNFYSYTVSNDFSRYVSITGSGFTEDAVYTMTIESLAKDATVTGGATSATSADLSATIASLGITALDADGNDVLEFSINGKTLKFFGTSTLQQVIDKVNSSVPNVTMTFENGEFSITKKMSEGTESKINIENISGTFFGAGSFTQIGVGEVANGNAKFKLNDDEYTMGTNKFTLQGMNFNLKKVTTDLVGPIEFDIERDIDFTINKIKDFVKSYNDLMTTLNNLVSEKKVSGYPPLTSEMKGEMTEKEIEQWEKLTKQGLLYRDSDVMKLRDDLQGLFSSKIAGFGSMADIGIGTGNYFEATLAGKYTGSIEIDENKLRKALEDDPQKVVAMFTTSPPTREYNPYISTDENNRLDYLNTLNGGGFLQRLTQTFDLFTDKITKSALSELNYTIQNSTSRLEQVAKDYRAKEEKLYAKFAAMETALANLQSQSDWFASQMSALTSSTST